MRSFSVLPLGALSPQKPFANYLPTYVWPDGTTTQGVKALRVKAERPASVRRCREGAVSRRRTWKAVQDNARPCKDWEGMFSQFAGGEVHLVRTLPRPTYCHGRFPPLFDKIRHKYIYKDAWCFTSPSVEPIQRFSKFLRFTPWCSESITSELLTYP
jgi:hypothetical protein